MIAKPLADSQHKLQNEQIKVLFLPKWYPNKMDPFDGNFVENHAHAISRMAKVCVLFVHSDESLKQDYFIEEQRNEKLLEVRCYFKKPKGPLSFFNKILTAVRYFKAQQKAYRYIQEKYKVNFNLSHIHVLSRTAPFAIWLKHKKKLPFGITEHWSGYLDESKEYRGFLKKIFTKKAVAKASFVTTVSPYLRDAMQKHNLYNNYYLIPNVVDCEVFKPIEKTARKKVKVLFVGNLLQSPKRILDIIEVFGRIKEKRKDFILDIYGEGRDEKACREKIKELDLEEFVQLKGTRSREEIAEIMAKSDFLFLYSEFENQPCVINEAQACGLPVVVPDIPGIKAFMQDELGLMFPRLNEFAFEASILQMMDNFNRYNSNNIRNYALRNFSEDVIANQFYELYLKSIKT